MIIATASWGLHVAALALAPMSVIQVSLAAGVVFIAVMADACSASRSAAASGSACS